MKRLVVFGALVERPGNEVPSAVQLRGKAHLLDKGVEVQGLEDRGGNRSDADDVEQPETAGFTGQRLQEVDERPAGFVFERLAGEPGSGRREGTVIRGVVDIERIERPLVLAALVHVEVAVLVEVVRLDVGQGKTIQIRFLAKHPGGDGEPVRGFDAYMRLHGGHLLTVDILDHRRRRAGERCGG